MHIYDQPLFKQFAHTNITRYLNYWNDFLTVECFADYYHYDDREADKIIKKGRILHHDQFGTESLPSQLAVKHNIEGA